jgi:hypothetical protein
VTIDTAQPPDCPFRRYVPAAMSVALFVAAVVVMTWPAWINGSPLGFFDSPTYYKQGREAVEATLALLAPAAAAPDASTGGGFGAAAASADFVRSLGYAGFVYVAAQTPLGLFGIVLAQSALIAGVLAVLIGQQAPVARSDLVLAVATCLALTPMAWFAAYLMPDILAVVPIVTAMILVRGLEGVGPSARLFLIGASTFAALSHYGHLPLGLAIGLLAVGILAVERRLTLVALVIALAPTGLAMATNAAASSVAFEEPSIAPKRLPLLLARSIADGPAEWHLEAHCDTYRYAICEIFDGDVPSNLGVLLWSGDGMLKKATPDQMSRIRAEEILILRRAFAEYPLEQTWSLVGNAVRQVWTIGMDDFWWARLSFDADGLLVADRAPNEDRAGLGAVSAVHLFAILAAVALVARFAWLDGLRVGRREREALLVLVGGLVVNAAIFGGLSAPVDRYQARIVWLLAVFAALLWLARRSPAGRTAAAS